MTENKERPIIAGLDIGTTKIVCMVAQQDHYGKLKILGVGKADSFGVARGEVVNIDMTVAAIREAVMQAEQKSGVDIRVVYVGIAGEHISSIQNRGILTLPAQDTEVEESHVKTMIDDMKKLALSPGERIIHVLPQEFLIDNQPVAKTPIGMCGSRLEANFHIITGKVTAAQNIKKCVERAGLIMSGLILEPLASSIAVLSEDEMEAGVALVDIGGGTTDIAIFQDNIIRHTAVIPFAGNIVTEDIKQGCKVLRKQAEQLKVKFGAAIGDLTSENEIISISGIAGRERKEISMPMLANIIQARMEEIIDQIAFEIKSSGYANRLDAGVVVTGGGSKLKHLKHLFELNLRGMETRIGSPAVYLGSESPKEINDPIYSTAIGLVLEGMKVMNDDTLSNYKKGLPLKEQTVETTPQPIENVDEKPIEEKEVKPIHPEMISTGKKKKKWWDGLIEKAKDWFEDDEVNADFNS